MSWGRSRGDPNPHRNRGFTHFANGGPGAIQPWNRVTDNNNNNNNNNSNSVWNRVRANFDPGYTNRRPDILSLFSKNNKDNKSSNQNDNSNSINSNHFHKSHVSVIPRSISLFSSSSDINIFNLIPRLFTITTNNSSAKFNIDILSKTSSIISKFHKKNPKDCQYHLDFDDEKNILQKFEKIYQGELVEFDPTDLDSLENFKKKLKIDGFPEFYITSESNDQKEFIFGSNSESKKWFSTLGKKAYFYSQKSSIKIDKNLIKDGFQYFTIQTKKANYKCNIFGILFSQTIREIIEKGPTINNYHYDFDDEEFEFSSIVDLFNFQSINLTKENVYSIKKMAEDLKIDIIVKDANCFIDNEEKLSKSIDDQQNNIDMIEELLENLYLIKEKKVDFVAEMIKNSDWSETKENVYELAALIFQVIENSIQVHEYIIDLLIKLNEEEGNLKFLLPFIVNNSILLFSDKTKENSCDFIIPFVYRMHKRNLIPNERLNKELITNNPQNMFFVSWFLPELIEINDTIEVVTSKNSTKSILKGNEIDNEKLFYPCDINKIDEYKKMRDCGEIGEITKALQNDDVDKFQSFISSDVEKLIKKTVPKNMFEPFIEKDMGYLNYAAAYGSIKCFKYLMLNNEKVNNLTFEMAVYGGNNELIRIVDNEINNAERKENEESKKNPQKKKKEPKDLSFIKELTLSIKLHRNELFDWILEQKTKKLDKNDLSSLFLCSIQNCNVHTMIQIIDNGFDYHLIMESFDQFIKIASENGFYLLDRILLDLFYKDIEHPISISSKSLISFGNILIYKLFEKSVNSEEILFSFLYSVKKGSFDIIKYIHQKIVDQKVKFNTEFEIKIIENCFQNHSKEILDFIIDIIDLSSFDVNMLFNFLDKTYKTRNFEATKKIVELIYKNNSKNDFTKQFIQASNLRLIDSIKYYIEKGYRINYNKLIDKIIKIKSNKEIYSLILKQIDPLIKSKSINLIDQAISNSNKPLIESLLDENISYENSLIKAVEKGDLEIVEIILKKHCEPSFVNKYYDDGTALNIAFKKGNMQIAKRLLSIPGIDPSIYDIKYQTPLIISAYKLNIEFFNLIFDFYGDEIKKQKWQLEKSIEFIIKKLTNKTENSDLIYILLKIINLNCIDPNIYTKKDTLLTFACTTGSIDLVNSLLKYDTIDVNLNIPNTGDTPLITAIKNNNKNNDITGILLSHPDENVNLKNYKNFSPLILATLNHQYDIVNYILKNDKFNHEESNIYYAFSIANAKIAKLLLSYKKFDVNYMDSIDNEKNQELKIKSPLIKAMDFSDIELLNSIIDNPSFIKKKSDLIDALKESISKSNVAFFKKILENLNEFDITINTLIFDGKTPMLEAIELNADIDMISFILNNSNYQDGKNIIDLLILSYKELCKSNKNYYIKLMNLFYDYDCNHNHLIDNKISEKESTFISEINESVIEILKNPNTLLKEAIKEDSYILFLFLIETNKIDFIRNIFIDTVNPIRTSYLHLAIILNRIKIVKELLTRNLVDVNARDSKDKTPLMEACKYKRIECIKLLFEKPDLNYKMKCYDQEAIEMVLKKNQKHLYKSAFQNIQNKDEYLNALLTALNDTQQLNKLAIKYTNEQGETKEEDPNELHPNKHVQKSNNKSIFDSWDSKKSDDSNKKIEKTDSNKKIEKTDSNKKIEKNDSNKSDGSKLDKSIQNSPTLNFEIYNESFFVDQNQKSQRNKSMINDDSDDISIKHLLKRSSSKRSNKNSGSFSHKSADFIVDDERNQQIFLEQENFMIEQQRQQWFQLIQINNQMQAQINMQMMNQVQFLEKTKKHSKKKK